MHSSLSTRLCACRTYSSLALASLILPGALLHGQPTEPDQDNAPVQLEPLVVTATRRPTPVDQTAATISVLETAQLAQSGITSADDALRALPGLTIAANGPGQTVGIFTRGSDSRHTSILINGKRLPTGLNRYFDLVYFPLNAFERIEVARGPLSSAKGGSALGGAINFMTPTCTVPGDVGGSLKVEYGSFDTRKAELSAYGATDTTYANIAGSVSSTNNDRPNNELNARSTLGSFGWSITPVLQAELVFGYLSFDGGTPGSLTFPSNNQTLDRELVFVLPSLTYRPNDNWTHTLSAALATQEDTQRGTGFNFDDDKEIASQSISYQADWQATDRLHLQVGAERYWQDVEVSAAPGPGGVFGLNYARYEVGTAGFAGLTYELSDDLTLIGSARRDVYEEFYGSANTWRYGLSYRVPRTGTRLHISDGTAFAAPEVQNNAYFSVALEPETTRSQEIGIEQDFGHRLTIGATAFHSEIKNLVEYIPALFTVQNVGVAEIYGIETHADYRPSDTVTLNLNYTYLQADNDLTARPLVRRPRHAINAQATWQATDRWLFGTALRSQLRRYDGFGPVQVEDFATVRIFANCQLRDNLRLSARVENLFDEDYAEVQGYPSQPLAAYASLEWRF